MKFILLIALFLAGYAAFSFSVDAAPHKAKGAPLPATLVNPACSPSTGFCEPMIPGYYGYALKGCGFEAGKAVTILDEVTYSQAWYVTMLFDNSAFIGQHAEISYSVGFPDALGCISNTFRVWGIGTHTFHAYQVLHGSKPKEMARVLSEVQPHHQEQADDPAIQCYFYHTPPECQ